MELTRALVQTDEQLSCDLDGETVLLSVREGMYLALDPVGSRIWALLRQPSSVAQLCARLVAEYEVEPDRCQADLILFLQELVDGGLLEFADE